MSNRLFSNLLSGTRRYFSALTGAPGIITPAPAQLSTLGQVPIAVQPSTVFRTPAPAALSLQGLSLAAPVVLQPAPAAVTLSGQVPTRQLIRIVIPSLPAPVASPSAPPTPTLLTQEVKSPATALLQLIIPSINVTQGGNIGFVSPAAAALTLSTLAYTFRYGEIGVGAASILGLAPVLVTTGVVQPAIGSVQAGGAVPELALPFRWVDDRPAPTSPWIADVAA